jgi:hypothetical protein
LTPFAVKRLAAMQHVVGRVWFRYDQEPFEIRAIVSFLRLHVPFEQKGTQNEMKS